MALIECKECNADISKKAKVCPMCGHPQGAKRYSLGKLILIIIFIWAIYSLLTPSSYVAKKRFVYTEPTTVSNVIIPRIIDIMSIAGKEKSDVASILGKPISCSITETKYGEKCYYIKAGTEIVFINKKADWISLNKIPRIPFSKKALLAIGLKPRASTVATSIAVRWKNIQGLNEVSIFSLGNKVDYIYVKTITK